METLRRSVPVHKTDYIYSDYLIKAAFHQTFMQWMPYFGATGNVDSTAVDQYMFAANFAPWFSFDYEMRRDDIDFSPMKALLSLRKDLVHCLYGDFIPLLPYSRDSREWLLWQLDNPKDGEGIIMAIARERSVYCSALAKPQFIDLTARYEIKTIKDLEYGEASIITGEQLAAGWLFETQTFPQAMMLHYKRL